jgi:hypothetical protein
MASVPYAMGWIENPAEVARIQATLPTPLFSATPANQVVAIPKEVFLWQAYKKLFGVNPPTKNQGQVGSCVSFGTNTAIRRTMASEIANGEPEEFKDIVEEATYGGSRVEVGGQRGSYQDGSVGVWAADFVRKWGVIARGKHGNYDLSEYNVQLCKKWGAEGVPDELEPTLRLHPVNDTTMVKTWDEAKKAIASGYGLAVCSNQGFKMQRDSKGVCEPSGSWAHCMAIDGYIEEGEEYGHIDNSWGENAHTGPVGWGDPPTSGFWARAAVIDRMLRQNDTWAFSKFQGFPAQTLNWLI